MVKIALVEDDENCRKETLSYAARFSGENGEEIGVECFSDGLEFLEKYSPIYSAVFMDIEMPYMNGLSAAKKLREKDDVVPIIFMTNMAQYAIKGYEVDATDYIVKPVSYLTFADKLKKALKVSERNFGYDVTIIRKDGRIRLKTSQIYYIEVMSHRIIYHTQNGDIENSGSLSSVQKEIGKYGFSRCNTYYLINLKYVTAVMDNTVYVGKDALSISRSKKKEFLSELAGFKGGSR